MKSLGINATLLHLHPFGSTNIENIEQLSPTSTVPEVLLMCFDQEPLILNYNKSLCEHIQKLEFNLPYSVLHQNLVVYSKLLQSEVCAPYGSVNESTMPIVLLNTERISEEKNKILKEFNFIDCNYFFHAFAAADWYRGYQYCAELIAPNKRTIKKKYITFNRLTGGARAYRSFLVAELAKHNLLDQGYVSYSDVCPEYGHYEQQILSTVRERHIPADYVIRARYALDHIQYPLRIDNDGDIPNGSQTLGPISALMESFLHVVTETCYWDEKTHLTEKIFKPIVARQPFVLLGCANNLKYLRSYGFKTFDAWWNESYDSITDPIERLQAVVKIINDICAMSNDDLTAMLRAMQHILDYNYNRFYSKEFVDYCWNELTENLQESLAQLPPRTSLET